MAIKELTARQIQALSHTARPIGRAPLNEKDFAEKYADRKRHGKTARDKAKKVKEKSAE